MELLMAGVNTLLGSAAFLAQSTDDSPPQDWSGSMVALGAIAMVTVITAVALWQVFTSWRARMSIAREESYRKLVEETGFVQKRLLEQQEAQSSLLGDLRSRIAGIEQTLRQID